MCVQAAAAQELDERCFLSAQSMPSLKVSEHFQVVKLLGEGSYGKVMLAVHRKRGACKTPMDLPETVLSQINQSARVTAILSIQMSI